MQAVIEIEIFSLVSTRQRLAFVAPDPSLFRESRTRKQPPGCWFLQPGGLNFTGRARRLTSSFVEIVTIGSTRNILFHDA